MKNDADYQRLYELGVNDGTHAALCIDGLIPDSELWEELRRSSLIADRSGRPYLDGYHAAYANACTPEVLDCFR